MQNIALWNGAGRAMKRRFAGAMEGAVLGAGISAIVLLAIPVCVLAVPIMLIWTLTDTLVQAIERME